MDFVALLSGGKDSCYNIYQCVKHGHRLVCLANLHPPAATHELNSFMYQCAGYGVIPAFEECLQVPLVRQEIAGRAVNTALEYLSACSDDEVEDLFNLLSDVLRQYPSIKGVSCGAIVSTYQRLRVENVCERLGLVSLSYLWQRDRTELIKEIVADGFEVILVKVRFHLSLFLSSALRMAMTVASRFNEKADFAVNRAVAGGGCRTRPPQASGKDHRLSSADLATVA